MRRKPPFSEADYQVRAFILGMGEQEESDAVHFRPELPTGRVKKIMKLDKDVDKVNSEALFLVSCSAHLFLEFLAQSSAAVAVEKKRKSLKLEHIRTAVKRHRPTCDFLLHSLPLPSDDPATNRDRPQKTNQDGPSNTTDKAAALGSRRIDDFFSKPVQKGE